MIEYIAYRPQVSMAQLYAFSQYVSQCRGSWTVSRSFVHAGDPRVLCLRWIVPGARWCDVPGYLDFLDQQQHRTLLRCFVRQAPKRIWDTNELGQLLAPGLASNGVDEALTFCERQAFLLVRGKTWQPGPSMERIANLGATFEWLVMENLQRFHQAIARRNVVLKELEDQQLGDLDVLAFTESGLVVTVECKSSSSGISLGHITRFLRRAALFPADIALLLIDTSDEKNLTDRLTQITSSLGASSTPRYLGCYTQEGSIVYHIQENIYIANTGGGIQTTLKLVLQVGASLKHS